MNKGSLEQWLQRLETLHPSEMELGLERVSVVAERLELLSPLAPVVTVAGSNGKGSTVAVLEALLLEAGRRTGSFTSPHFLRFNERIRVAGEEAKDIEIVAAFAAIDDARQDISLTYFEFATLAALWIFRDRGVDVILLEVGLDCPRSPAVAGRNAGRDRPGKGGNPAGGSTAGHCRCVAPTGTSGTR
jgi:dihydrofolate synthase/folylpolyglutamate synthase